ncbi:MAG: DUF6599 family protein, partial [Gemmatimonadota bacterium]
AADAAAAVARQLAAGLPDRGEPVRDLALLPARGRVAGSEQYFRRDALSLDFLAHTFTAQYRVGDAEVTGFLSRQPTAASADTALARYRAYLSEFGAVRQESRDGDEWLHGDLGGYYDVVFRRGEVLAGVTLVQDADLAERAARGLWQELAEGRGNGASR